MRRSKAGVKENTIYLSLQLTDQKLVQSLACLVTVADVFERLGRILAADIEKDLLTTAIWAHCVSVLCFYLAHGLASS